MSLTHRCKSLEPFLRLLLLLRRSQSNWPPWAKSFQREVNKQMTEFQAKADPIQTPPGSILAPDALGEDIQRVPLVMYEDDRRIVIGTADVNTKTMEVKGKIEGAQTREVTEIVGTVFTLGGPYSIGVEGGSNG